MQRKRLSNASNPVTGSAFSTTLSISRDLSGSWQLGRALQGLTTEQYKANLATYGPNALTPPPTMPAWLKFLLQFTNFFALLLLAGGTLCFVGYGIDSSRTGEDVEADPTNVRPSPLLSLCMQMHPFGIPRELTTVVGVCVRAAVPRRCTVPRGDHHRHLLALPGGQVGADHGGCDSQPLQRPHPQTTSIRRLRLSLFRHSFAPPATRGVSMEGRAGSS